MHELLRRLQWLDALRRIISEGFARAEISWRAAGGGFLRLPVFVRQAVERGRNGVAGAGGRWEQLSRAFNLVLSAVARKLARSHVSAFFV